jgi:hypothetical protein
VKNPKSINCKQCNKTFEQRHYKQLFCSLSCSQKNVSNRLIETFCDTCKTEKVITKNIPGIKRRCVKCCTHVCRTCNKEFYSLNPNRKVCSTACNVPVINTTRIKEQKFCKECSNPVEKIFCNSKCQQAFNWKQIKSKIEETGIVSVVTGKRYLKEKYGHKCAICDTENWMGQPVLLILDHIDGNSSNWNLTNLRLICSNCDAQTPTYKARNKGNGRHYRKVRYANGQSY